MSEDQIKIQKPLWGIVPRAEFISYLKELTTKENNNKKQKDGQ